MLNPFAAAKFASATASTFPSGNAAFTQEFRNSCGKLFQQPVTGGNAEGIVVELKIDDVGADNVVLLVRVAHKDLLGFLEEEFLAVQPGQPVILELVDHGSSLLKVENAGNPVENYLRTVGLGNEVRSAVRQGGDFSVLAAGLGHYNHRNQR